MRIRKRRPTTTSAGGVPPPPHPHGTHRQEYTPVGCSPSHVQAESLRSELVTSATAAAAASAQKKKKKKKPNCTAGAATTATTTTTTTTNALHNGTFNNLSLLITRVQREACTSMRTAVATSQSDGRGPRVVLDHTKKTAARISTDLEEEGKFSSLLSCSPDPNNSGFRPASAAALAVLSGQRKHEDEDVNAESELEGIQRHIPSNWAMPSLQGLRRSRSRSNSTSVQKLRLPNDASLAGTNDSNACNSLQDEAQIISMNSRSSDDGSIMQGVQQACRQTTNWPEVAVKTAGPHYKLPFTRFYKEEIATLEQMKMKTDVQVGKIKKKPEEDLLMRSKCRLVDNNNIKADQKREALFRSSICSSDGSKQLLPKLDKLKMSFQGTDGKINDSGNYGMKAHRSQFFAVQNGSGQINHHEEIMMVSKCKQSSGYSGTATATRENGVGDGDILEDQVATAGMNNSISKKRERTENMTAAVAAGSDKMGKESNSKYHSIDKQITTDDDEARRMKKKLGVSGTITASAGTSSRWRKKCRPVFRSINDIQRRAPLIQNNNNNRHHAAASDNVDHIDESASTRDHQGDTTQAHDHHGSTTTSACTSTAAVISRDQHDPNGTATSHIDNHSLDIHHHCNGGKPDDNVVLMKKKKKKKLNKINNLMMTIMDDVVADAADQEQPRMISTLSNKSCKAVHNQLFYHHHRRLVAVQQLVQQLATPDRHDAAASHRSLPAIQLNVDTSSPAHRHLHLHQTGDHNATSQPINCRCSLNSDPFEWRPDFSHFI